MTGTGDRTVGRRTPSNRTAGRRTTSNRAAIGLRTSLVAAITLFVLSAPPARGSLATHSFTDHAGGTHPMTLVRSGNTITVDLSAISGAIVHRATLDPGQVFDHIDLSMNSLPSSTMRISHEGSSAPLLPPRHEKFDLTAAVQQAVGGNGALTLSVDDAGIGFGDRISLDVLCDVALPLSIPPVTSTQALFENGDAMITFTEPAPILAVDSVSCVDFWDAMQSMDVASKTRFRIYRADEPLITEAAVIAAVLVDEIKPLSGWNPRFLGPGGGCYPPQGGGDVFTLPVGDGVHAAGSTGIYIDRYRGNGSDEAFYFVSHTVDGAEDFSQLEVGLNASTGVTRTPGTGMVLLNKTEYEPEIVYGASAGQYYYVKWETSPTSNFPSSPFNYLVAVPAAEFAVPEPGVDLALHCWGGSLNGCFGWWYHFEQGHLLASGNQFPFQDWWTGYHENLGTLRADDEGTVKPFTMHRLLAFVHDFVTREYGADIDRITLAGSSMGGSGTSMVGLRNGHIFSNLISWVGIHIPRDSPTFATSFENAWGPMERLALFSNVEFAERFGGEVVSPGDAHVVWDYYDNDQWLRAHPDIETPWLTYSNGVNDGGIGWEQAMAHTQALIDTRRPFNFQWGMEGHSQRVALLDPYGYDKTQKSHLLFTRDQSLPIFQHASTDDDFHVDPTGKINAFCSWNTDDIVDEIDRWEISIFIPDAPGGGSYGVVFPDSLQTDIGPGRLQNFSPMPGNPYQWTWTAAGDTTIIDGGEVIADVLGRVIVPQLTVLKSQPRRLSIVGDAAPNGVVQESSGPARGLILRPVRPNPFSHSTEIRYSLPQSASTQLKIFDAAGRRIRTLVDNGQPAGERVVIWDGADDRGRAVPSGIYFARLTTGERTLSRRLLLMK